MVKANWSRSTASAEFMCASSTLLFQATSSSSAAGAVNLSTATCLPGLIDVHVHLTADPRNIGYKSLGISVPRATLTGARNARATLFTGFTTVRNLAASEYSDMALRDAIEAGDNPRSGMLAPGPALGI